MNSMFRFNVCMGVTVDLPPFSLHTRNPASLQCWKTLKEYVCQTSLLYWHTDSQVFQQCRMYFLQRDLQFLQHASLATGLKTKPDICFTMVSIASK